MPRPEFERPIVRRSRTGPRAPLPRPAIDRTPHMPMSRKSSQGARLLLMLVRRRNGGIAWRRIAVVLAAVALYLALQPWLVRSFDLPLPGLADWRTLATAPTAAPDSEPNAAPDAIPQSPPSGGGESAARFLRDIGGGALESPAGLRYGPGSVHGHRLKHVLAHRADRPERAGQHGVFDADTDVGVLTLIDTAYRLALAGKQTQTRHEGRRTVYTVDLGRRIGFVGGASGGRRAHPPARHIRLVLEDRNVITAFPLIP